MCSIMAFTEINNFANMEANDKFDWIVQARVFRKWDQVNRVNGIVFGLNLLLIDEFVRTFKNFRLTYCL